MTNEKRIVAWNECELATSEMEYLRSVQDDEELEWVRGLDDEALREEVFNNMSFWETQTEWYLDSLTELLNDFMEKYPCELFAIEGSKLGWRNLAGNKVIQSDLTGEELSREIFPECQYTSEFSWDGGSSIDVRLSHHDSPTGESYEIRALAPKVGDTVESNYYKKNPNTGKYEGKFPEIVEVYENNLVRLNNGLYGEISLSDNENLFHTDGIVWALSGDTWTHKDRKFAEGRNREYTGWRSREKYKLLKV